MLVSTSWDEASSLADTLDILEGLALRFAQRSGPYENVLTTLVKQRRWRELIDLDLCVAEDVPVHHLIAARQVLGFYSKLEDLDIGVDKEAVAFRKFQEAQNHCLETNALIRGLRAGRVSLRPRVLDALLRAKRKIKAILGPCPALGSLDFGFGPGATTAIRKADASVQRKLAAGLQCSTDSLASSRLPDLLREVSHWSAALGNSKWSIDDEGWLLETIPVEVVPGRLEFVPKNAKTYRSIVVEPSLNGFVQAGLGRYIGKRLRGVGVDIRDQTRNQQLALRGSLDGSVATIDLSSASDTVSRELVRFLLPRDWYLLLASFRTSEVSYKKEAVFLEMFSSMGNGFTFPLETLIFYAITQSCCGSPDVSVYGDDIICPTVSYEYVTEVLNAAGFLVNSEKSFASGPFRESCGRDYYKGINVRPFYLKHQVSGQSLFTMHNFFYRLHDEEVCALVKSHIPPCLRTYGPDGYGDGHLLSLEWKRQRAPKQYAGRGFGGSYFKTYTLLPRRHVNLYPGDWVSPLYTIYTRALAPLSDSLRGLVAPTSSVDTERGKRPYWPVPGGDGYKSTLIYTLEP